MTTKLIKKLAVISYTGKSLDIKKITRISKLLNRAQLKRYVQFLKNFEQAKTVQVIMPKLDTNSSLTKELKKIFPDKQLQFSEDKSLIAGVKLIDNDNVYDFNLKNTLQNLVSYINR
jgi:F0F1-type ATP synthase delta subunit